MLERDYQAYLIKKLYKIFGRDRTLILKNDTGYLQGIPDLLILHEDCWGILEVKKSFDSPYEPNQEYYLDFLDNLSYAEMICPENEEEVLDGLQYALKGCRPARVS